jgi:hypothetical protein
VSYFVEALILSCTTVLFAAALLRRQHSSLPNLMYFLIERKQGIFNDPNTSVHKSKSFRKLDFIVNGYFSHHFIIMREIKDRIVDFPEPVFPRMLRFPLFFTKKYFVMLYICVFSLPFSFC